MPPCLMAKKGFLWHRSNVSVLLALFATDLANLWRSFLIFHVYLMLHSENIAIFAILLGYFDISVIGFVMFFWYCISVFERYYSVWYIHVPTYCPALEIWKSYGNMIMFYFATLRVGFVDTILFKVSHPISQCETIKSNNTRHLPIY